MPSQNPWRPSTRISAVGIAVAVLTLALALGSCASGVPDIESIGLSIEASIQAGEVFEVTVPAQSDTTLSVESAPAGVIATITTGSEPQTNLLRVEVADDTPRGSYNLGIAIAHDGETTVVSWPFDVVD